MSTDDPSTANEFGITAHKLYRKSMKETRQIIGLGAQLKSTRKSKTRHYRHPSA
jgi:hypothetical protein